MAFCLHSPRLPDTLMLSPSSQVARPCHSNANSPHSRTPALLADPQNLGKVALIHGDKVDSVWPTMDEALAAGYDRFGLEQFLVQEIVEKERVYYFSRNVPSCR